LAFQPDANSLFAEFPCARFELIRSESVDTRIGWDGRHAKQTILVEYIRLEFILPESTGVISNGNSFPLNAFTYLPDLIVLALTQRLLWRILASAPHR
jgi:hypothetical protein